MSVNQETAFSSAETLPDVLTTEEVADLLRINVKMVRRLARKGELPTLPIKRPLRFPRDGVLEWMVGKPCVSQQDGSSS